MKTENKLRVQITEKYDRDIFIDVVVPAERLAEFNKILGDHEYSYEDYESLYSLLSNLDFEILFLDDNDGLFSFRETCDIHLSRR